MKVSFFIIEKLFLVFRNYLSPCLICKFAHLQWNEPSLIFFMVVSFQWRQKINQKSQLNSKLQLPLRIFYRTEDWRLTRPLHNVLRSLFFVSFFFYHFTTTAGLVSSLASPFLPCHYVFGHCHTVRAVHPHPIIRLSSKILQFVARECGEVIL